MEIRLNACSVKGCNNSGKLHRNGHRYFPRGFCSTHYKIWVKSNRDIVDQDKIKPSECSVDGCNRPKPYKRGLCELHYTRLMNNGDVNIVQKRREGQTSHYLYNTYGGMKSRCLSSVDKDYKNYGARGISICERWLGVDGFFNFIEDMGDRPEGMTLDRRNSNGDYSPENCRWADVNTQAINKDYSKLKGVSYYNNLKKYRARITVNKKPYELGMFKTLEEARSARENAEIKLLGSKIEL